MAYTLIGGTTVGTVLILLFLPALYAAWFRISPTPVDRRHAAQSGHGPSPDAVHGTSLERSADHGALQEQRAMI